MIKVKVGVSLDMEIIVLGVRLENGKYPTLRLFFIQ